MNVNRRLSTITNFTTCLAVLQLNLLAQSWETILDYHDFPDAEGNGGLVADSLGNVFAGGNVSSTLNGSGPWQGIVLKTDASAAAWAPSGDNTISQYPNPAQLNLGIDLSGNLYSVGGLTLSSGAAPSWYLRKSTDQGVTWNTKDLYQYATGKTAAAVAIAADPVGNIFALGYGRDKSGAIHWVTRKSGNAGETWSTVDDVKGATPTSCHCAANGVLFAAGGNSSWFVRRSTDAGRTWTTIDNPFPGWAHGLTSDTLGNIYVAGRASKTSGKAKNFVNYDEWIIRKSSDGGNTWVTIDTFTAAQSKSSCARAISSDAFGNIIAVGYADNATTEYWTVRKLLTTGFWETIDAFENGAWADARSLAVNAAGNLLVNGIVGDASGFSHWIVRRLSP